VIELYEDFKRGSAEGRAVFELVSFHLGRGLAMLADVLNPERIILGGIGMRLFDTLVVPAKRVFETEALPQAVSACAIVPAQLGEAIGDVASLCAALDQGRLLLEPENEFSGSKLKSPKGGWSPSG
jgi:glucokinase